MEENPAREKNRFSLYRLEAFLAGEGDTVSNREMETRLESDPALRDYAAMRKSLQPSTSFEALRRRIAAEEARPVPAPRRRPDRFREWLAAWQALTRPSAWPRAAFASFLVLALGGLALWLAPSSRDRLPGEGPPGESHSRMKGNSRVSVTLEGRELASEVAAPVRAGDTLRFQYQWPKPLHVQLWFRDDGGPLQPYLSSGSPLSRWPSSPDFASAPPSLVLADDWNQEELWLLWSERAFTDSLAAQTIRGGKPPSGLHLKRYRFVRGP